MFVHGVCGVLFVGEGGLVSVEDKPDTPAPGVVLVLATAVGLWVTLAAAFGVGMTAGAIGGGGTDVGVGPGGTVTGVVAFGLAVAIVRFRCLTVWLCGFDCVVAGLGSGLLWFSVKVYADMLNMMATLHISVATLGPCLRMTVRATLRIFNDSFYFCEYCYSIPNTSSFRRSL